MTIVSNSDKSSLFFRKFNFSASFSMYSSNSTADSIYFSDILASVESVCRPLSYKISFAFALSTNCFKITLRILLLPDFFSPEISIQ